MPHTFARIIGGGVEREPAGHRQAPEEQQQQQQQQRTGGIRGWLSGGRRGNDGVLESPVVTTTPGQEMRSVDSNIVSPISPVIGQQRHDSISPPTSPLSRNNPMGYSAMGFYAPQPMIQAPMQPIIERPEPAMQRGDVGISANVTEQPNDSRTTLIDLEAQGLMKPEGKWFWQKDSWKGLQSKLVTVLISGLFLVITLAVYLGLALANDLHLRLEWHVLLILIILIATMFFCHALVRLCIMATNPGRFQRLSRNFTRIPSVAGPGGYANPREPIRIRTPFGTDDPNLVDPTKSPPPVYGLWRCSYVVLVVNLPVCPANSYSVRVNPDQFYWVRRTSASVPTIPEGREHSNRNSRTTPRPPSYASDDGVTYALAPHQLRHDPPLPPHPSEVNRMR